MESKYHDAFLSIKNDIELIVNHFNGEIIDEGIRNFETLEEACNKAATYDEKEKPKGVIIEGSNHLILCPICERRFATLALSYEQQTNMYCPICGQKLKGKYYEQ